MSQGKTILSAHTPVFAILLSFASVEAIAQEPFEACGVLRRLVPPSCFMFVPDNNECAGAFHLDNFGDFQEGDHVLVIGLRESCQGTCFPCACISENTIEPCPVCGNDVLETTEECDDGNTARGDGCDENCILEVCGNGVIQINEQCDDANTGSGDGCSATCQIEPGFGCSGEPSVCAEIVPAVSQWGVFLLGLVVLAAGTIVIRRRTRASHQV